MKRDKKSRPGRYTDTNRRRNMEASSTKSRQIAPEYQKPVRIILYLLVSFFLYFVFNLG